MPLVGSAEYVGLFDEKSVSLIDDVLDHLGAGSTIFNPEGVVNISLMRLMMAVSTVEASMTMTQIFEEL